MWLERRLGPAAVAVLVLAGCGGGTRDSEPGTTYEYVVAVRPLAYENAREACRGHSLTSLAFEYGTTGATRVDAARSWARRNQRDARLREVSYRGCRDGLRETAEQPVLVERPPLTDDEVEVYVLEYSTCRSLTLAELVRDLGVDARGLTVEEAVRAVVRRSYDERYRDVAFGACLAAIRGEPPRYGP